MGVLMSRRLSTNRASSLMPCRTVVIVAMRVRRSISMAMIVDVGRNDSSATKRLVEVSRFMLVTVVMLVVRMFGKMRLVDFSPTRLGDKAKR